MKELTFRPFKRLSDKALVDKIHEVFNSLKSEDKYYKEKFALCDKLIKEAKIRNLCCSKEMMVKKILSK
ncbi:hypothetical protein [Marinisporobacter balticus]|uniref:Uncharacterized protein n=1 Tax=Marinisporobacter balticus TaxID=2018667 RepID=A0A4R2K5H1_9FIRM|nr:hypothetical protein [Marinisporobacter balticus]TCO68481.1 hypothetical protein EV214_1442 [Marinisporobacter balticus]